MRSLCWVLFVLGGAGNVWAGGLEELEKAYVRSDTAQRRRVLLRAQVYGSRAMGLLLRGLRDKDWAVRVEAVGVIGRLGRRGRGALGVLRLLASQRDARVRGAVVQAVSRMGLVGTPLLIRWYAGKDYVLRWMAYRGLLRYRGRLDGVIAGMLARREVRLRRVAWLLRGRRVSLIPVLMGRLGRRTWYASYVIGRILRRYPRSGTRLLWKYLENGQAKQREAAVRAFAWLRRRGLPWLPVIRAMRKDPNSGVRAAARYTLKKLGRYAPRKKRKKPRRRFPTRTDA